MSVMTERVVSVGANAGIIDCDIHPLMRSPSHLKTYLPQRWREYFDAFGSHHRQPFAESEIYPKASPHISRRDAVPPSGPPGSDLAFMQEQLLDPNNITYGILQVLRPAGANEQNQDYGAAVCAALNEWQLQEWTGQDRRLRASLMVTQETPDQAITEIKRRSKLQDFAVVSLSQRSLEPLGRRRYWPIYAEAVECDLPIGLHNTGNNGHSPVPGGGWCSFYAEYHQLSQISMQAIVTSFIMEGVFEQFPKLRVLLIEGGFTWLPALGWRLDRLWERLRAEVPHVKRPPSEYIRKHFWLSTQPMDHVGQPDQLRRIVDWIGWDRLVFSSDYPHWDYDDARYAFPIRMSEDERAGLLRGNAARLLGSRLS